MTEEIAKKPTKGTWDNLGKQQDKISFDINIPYVIEFLTDVPEEIPSTINPGSGEVYYRFPVKIIESGIVTNMETSAWTLLAELKTIAPLKGKKVQIIKKIDKGKQKFVVTALVG